MPTIVTDPKVLAAKYNQAFNSHDETVLRSLISPNARFSAPGDVRLEGKDAVIGYTNGWMKALPDAKINVTHEIVSGPWIVQEFTFAGTHTGPLTTAEGTIPASGKRQETPAAFFFTFAGDKIKESRHYFDSLTLLKQIGAQPK